MNKYEIVALAICIAMTTVSGFDFIIYAVKSAPKKAMFKTTFWKLSFLCLCALIYWYINGMRFV